MSPRRVDALPKPKPKPNPNPNPKPKPKPDLAPTPTPNSNPDPNPEPDPNPDPKQARFRRVDEDFRAIMLGIGDDPRVFSLAKVHDPSPNP